ncbi:GGDEF domain-containing protein [Desulfitobacterium chlororespirans]|uniref:Diguanylate cyclase (GGDEF) domain-containing protein n=1 Tax=Desulfitobacterium chlororespirans DSM 11544 TaxID=1121395 RepID=A0A1M7RRX6_9FIRM|nr:GGDEF domain-containing protein [Desulfitobacterium chlororespirans]SHN48984.1 diguanylate cyclase (GGDEF) domain-containing protein [Desulfitobacterium chlororespirans DSM 11544]
MKVFQRLKIFFGLNARDEIGYYIENNYRFNPLFEAITELPNRFYFEEKVNQLITKNEDPGKTFALLYMDIDNFKNINDSLGHSSGDVLIQYIGEILKRQVNEPRNVSTIA